MKVHAETWHHTVNLPWPSLIVMILVHKLKPHYILLLGKAAKINGGLEIGDIATVVSEVYETSTKLKKGTGPNSGVR